MEPRFIPVLLLHDGGLVKTRGFRRPTYIGDPINTLRIFNDLGADEVLLLDIDASAQRRGPDPELLQELAREAFMPLCYGGGIRSLDEARTVFQSGLEKVAINQAHLQDMALVSEVAAEFGNQSVVGAMDVHRSRLGRLRVWDHVKGRATATPALDHAKALVAAGAGEVFVQWVQADGEYSGLDHEAVRTFADALDVPLVVCGGASSLEDMAAAVRSGASAAAAGSLFVYRGRRNGVLVNYPSRPEIEALLAADRPAERLV